MANAAPRVAAGRLDVPFARPFDRVLEILLGTLASILIAMLIRPNLWRRGAAPPEPRATPRAAEA